MRATLTRLARMTASYSLVTLLGPLFTVVLTPLYTRVLSPADYGVVDVALTLSMLLNLLATLGLDQALSAHFFDGEAAHQRDLVTTAVLCVGGTGLLFGAALAGLAAPLAAWLFKDFERRYLFDLLALNTVSGPIYAVTIAALRLRMGVKRVNLLGLVYLAATVMSNVVLILIFRLHATGVVAANTVTLAIVCGMGLVLAWQPLRGQFSSALLKPLVRTGLSLVPAAFSNVLFLNADRLLLTQYVTQTDIGLYSIANKLVNIGFVLLSAAWIAWWPLALEMAPRPEATQQYARVLEYFIAASCWLSLSVGLFAPEILAVFTRAVYVPAAPYALVLLISGPINMMAGFFQIGLFVHKKTGMISLAYAITAAVNIALNLILNPFVGVWGAVIATVFASAVMAGVTYQMGQRTLRVPYRARRISILAASYLFLIAAYLLLPPLNAVAFKIIALSVFAVLPLAIGVISPGQIQIALQAACHHVIGISWRRME